jgi:hypothetical protein
MLQPRPRPWQRFLGNVEGCLAAVCAVVVFTAQTTPAHRFQVPWLWMCFWALGIGCGVGAVRFGGPSARLAGGLSAGILTVALVVLAVVKSVQAGE